MPQCRAAAREDDYATRHQAFRVLSPVEPGPCQGRIGPSKTAALHAEIDESRAPRDRARLRTQTGRREILSNPGIAAPLLHANFALCNRHPRKCGGALSGRLVGRWVAWELGVQGEVAVVLGLLRECPVVVGDGVRHHLQRAGWDIGENTTDHCSGPPLAGSRHPAFLPISSWALSRAGYASSVGCSRSLS